MHKYRRQTQNDNYLKKNNICPYNYYGYCENENCTLIHTKPNTPSICINYIKHGKCTNENCTRIHENIKVNKYCKFYKNNTCYYNDNCNFIHTDIRKNNKNKEKNNNIDNNIIDLLKYDNIKIIKLNKTDNILYDINRNNFYYINSNYINMPPLKRVSSY